MRRAIKKAWLLPALPASDGLSRRACAMACRLRGPPAHTAAQRRRCRPFRPGCRRPVAPHGPRKKKTKKIIKFLTCGKNGARYMGKRGSKNTKKIIKFLTYGKHGARYMGKRGSKKTKKRIQFLTNGKNGARYMGKRGSKNKKKRIQFLTYGKNGARYMGKRGSKNNEKKNSIPDICQKRGALYGEKGLPRHTPRARTASPRESLASTPAASVRRWRRMGVGCATDASTPATTPTCPPRPCVRRQRRPARATPRKNKIKM